MSGGTHMAAGALAGAGAAAAAGGLPWQGAAVGALAALLPDLDHPQARAWHLVVLAVLLGTAGALGQQAGRLPWSAPIALAIAVYVARWLVPRVLGHRGPTHSLLFALALAVFVGVVGGAQIGAPAAAGYGSHLLLDALTPAGVPLLWPVLSSRIRLATVPEWLLVAALLIGGAVVLAR